MNYANLTISELERLAANSDNALVLALNVKMQEIIEQIELLEGQDKTNSGDKYQPLSDFDTQIEYIKKLAGLANNF